MTKKYTLTTSEETVTENPEDIIRLMKLAGLTNAQPVAEEEAEVYEPTEANDDLDLDDYSKKSPESIAKQKKSIQPTLGDNPLEYSLDENEIQEALMKEFDEDEKLAEERTDEIAPLIPALALAGRALAGAALRNPVKTAVAATVLGGGDDEEKKEQPVNASKKKKGEKLNAVKEETEETEEVTEAQSPAQKAAFEKMLAAKNGKKDDTVEEKEETTEEKVEETTVEENLQKADEEIKKLKEDCSCGHGSDCDCGSDCGCGCNAVNEAVTIQDAVNESQERLKYLISR